jgi:PPM family protein phosphatase
VLGTDPDVDVDTITIETRSGDLFLLCSDGLYSMVGNDRILELVERNRRDLDAAAKALVAAANKGGGDDNITIVAFEIASPDDEAEPTVESAAPEEEDTLTEADRVPTVSVEPEEEPEPPAGPKPPRIVLALLAILILAAVASIVLYLLVR